MLRLVWTLLFLPALVLAAVPDQDVEAKAKQIADQLRCPVCRGIPIAESPSELARDMMALIREQLAQGKSEEEILAYFESRYGEWILLNPKPRGMNLALWIVPLALLLGGGIFLFFKINTWSRRP